MHDGLRPPPPVPSPSAWVADKTSRREVPPQQSCSCLLQPALLGKLHRLGLCPGWDSYLMLTHKCQFPRSVERATRGPLHSEYRSLPDGYR